MGSNLPTVLEGIVSARRGHLQEIRERIAADRLGTIAYEVVCGIGPRVPRRYHDAGAAR